MIRDLKKYSFHYFVLFLLFCIGLFLFIQSPHNQNVQQLVIVYLTSSYFIWGMLHHWIADRVTYTLMLEYALVALLGLLIAQSMLIGI